MGIKNSKILTFSQSAVIFKGKKNDESDDPVSMRRSNFFSRCVGTVPMDIDGCLINLGSSPPIEPIFNSNFIS